MMLNVQPFQETLYAGMCGPASLKIVTEYFGIKKTEKELADMCGVDEELGVSDKDIVNTAQTLGFETTIKDQASFNDIEELLKKDIPVIVNWFTRGRTDYSDSDVADGHYSVVCGLDSEHIFLQDPEIGGIRKIERDDFMKVWFDFTGPYIKSWDEMIIRQIIVVYPKDRDGR
jgi:predicted double-glycine peptidase